MPHWTPILQAERLHFKSFPRLTKRIPFSSGTHPSIKALFNRKQFWKAECVLLKFCQIQTPSIPMPFKVPHHPQSPQPPHPTRLLQMLPKEKGRDTHTQQRYKCTNFSSCNKYFPQFQVFILFLYSFIMFRNKQKITAINNKTAALSSRVL